MVISSSTGKQSILLKLCAETDPGSNSRVYQIPTKPNVCRLGCHECGIYPSGIGPLNLGGNVMSFIEFMSIQ